MIKNKLYKTIPFIPIFGIIMSFILIRIDDDFEFFNDDNFFSLSFVASAIFQAIIILALIIILTL